MLARTARLAAACAAALWLAGCLSVGREFPVAPVERIEIGETTRSDVARLFGRPWRTGLESGQTTWTYGHYRYALFGETRTRDLVIRFDDSGVVESYSFNTTYPEDLR